MVNNSTKDNVKLKNDFPKDTYRLFTFNYECWWCGKNHWNCLHHILGRSSNSPLNAAPLNNFNCHLGNGELSHFKSIKKLLHKTLHYLLQEGYQLTEKDKEFMRINKKYYKDFKNDK